MTWDCATCGACCREAFDTVPVGEEDEATAVAQPGFVETAADGWRAIRRVPSPILPERTRCAALCGDGGAEPFRCVMYADRPRACAELDVGGEACVFARTRLGLPVG